MAIFILFMNLWGKKVEASPSFVSLTKTPYEASKGNSEYS